VISAAILQPAGVLAGFGDGELATLAGYLEATSLSPGEQLWPAGSGAERLFIVLSGRVELSRPTEFPERRVIMGLFGPGSVVGETGFFSGGDEGVLAFAVEKTEAAHIDGAGLTALARGAPEVHALLLAGVMRSMAKRLDRAYSRMSSVF